ncbi:unnamed protein product [Gongylonema pulchrum]|uniref:Ras-related protein Rab-21 n=1 Tax=Gongylonema pulchrum TaxID=637853 RepID=A0A183CXB7_9BILA|nr:unnamed protein product [Gongylonema pulchrum]
MPHTSRMINKPDLKGKVIFVGKSGVGKTSIILRHDGQGFYSKLPMYLRNAVAAVIVYDITDRESFLELKKWINVSLFIVGNKLDLENARTVTHKEGVQLAEQVGAAFHETSALNGEGIRKVITAIAEHLLERQTAQSASSIHLKSPPSSSDDTTNRKQGKFCCSSG